MASRLLRVIQALTHDDIDVSFENHGYNANMLVLTRRAADGHVASSVRVALPDDHLDDEKVISYLTSLEQELLRIEDEL